MESYTLYVDSKGNKLNMYCHNCNQLMLFEIVQLGSDSKYYNFNCDSCGANIEIIPPIFQSITSSSEK